MCHLQQTQFQVEALFVFVSQFAVSAQHDLQMARQVFFAEKFRDAGDAFPGTSGAIEVNDTLAAPSTRTFGGAPTGLALHDIALLGGGVRATAQVLSPGWLATISFSTRGTLLQGV